MTAYHLFYSANDSDLAKAIEPTKALFSTKPWRHDTQLRLHLAEQWLIDIAAAYELEHDIHLRISGAPNVRQSGVRVVRADDPLAAGQVGHILRIRKWSLTLLFKATAQLLLDADRIGLPERFFEDGNFDSDTEASFGWACSLFYAVKPAMFVARVKEGRIKGISVEELEVPPTLDSLEPYEFYGSESAGNTRPSEHTSDYFLVHSEAAGFNVLEASTRPLRRYATSIGIEGSWSMAKNEILRILGESEPVCNVARNILSSQKSELTPGVVR